MEKLSAKKNNWQKPSLSLRDISPKGRAEVTGWRLLQSADCFRLR